MVGSGVASYGGIWIRVLSTLCNVITLRASEAAAQCIVIGPVCLFVGVWVCAFVGLLRQ